MNTIKNTVFYFNDKAGFMRLGTEDYAKMGPDGLFAGSHVVPAWVMGRVMGRVMGSYFGPNTRAGWVMGPDLGPICRFWRCLVEGKKL
jgi:hypothetical protein